MNGTVPQAIGAARPIIGSKSTATSAAEMTVLARHAAAAFVERETRRTGSRMVAYEIVAQSVGTSASWLRKFISGGSEAKEPSWTVGWNILAAYRRVCERVEQAAENERAQARALERQIDAATAGTDAMVARAAQTPPSSGSTD